MQATIKRADITRMALYIGNCRKTVAQIKRETGADYILNAGGFSGTRPVMYLKVDGKVLSGGGHQLAGLAFNGADDMAVTTDWARYQSAVNWVGLRQDGKEYQAITGEVY